MKKKKVCSSRTSAATSHSAHFHHLPLSFSFCWQIKIHGLPSHPFSLCCLIVLKIEEITGCNLCTNKNLSETWQCIPWHTDTHIGLMILWAVVHHGIPQIPSCSLFNTTLSAYHASKRWKKPLERRKTLTERRMKITHHHSMCFGADQHPLASFLWRH